MEFTKQNWLDRNMYGKELFVACCLEHLASLEAENAKLRAEVERLKSIIREVSEPPEEP